MDLSQVCSLHGSRHRLHHCHEKQGFIHADTLIVYAKTDPNAGKHGITGFIVEKGMKARDDIYSAGAMISALTICL
jgi:hypothetical protein